MPKGQKQDSLYKSLAIFTCSSLIFTLIGVGVRAQIENTYNKVTGNELMADHWNNLADDFLFKEPKNGQGEQRINDNIGINENANPIYDLIAGGPIRASHILTTDHNPINQLDNGEIVATLFTGDLSASLVTPGLFGHDSSSPDGNYLFPNNLTIENNLIVDGNINADSGNIDGNQLCISGDCIDEWGDVTTDIDELWKKHDTADNSIHPKSIDYRVGIGTTTPQFPLDVDGIGRFVEIQMNNYTGTSTINMSQGNIVDVAKITVGTIDPLYRIDGINYSTFASAIVGGVKEELISRAFVNKKNNTGEYEYVIDFSKQKRGSELWVWYHTVDFSKDNIEVLITPYGSFAQTYYLIKDDKLILRSSEPVEVSYRLMGKRFDWRNWPLKADDQKEAPSFKINTNN